MKRLGGGYIKKRIRPSKVKGRNGISVSWIWRSYQRKLRRGQYSIGPSDSARLRVAPSLDQGRYGIAIRFSLTGVKEEVNGQWLQKKMRQHQAAISLH